MEELARLEAPLRRQGIANWPGLSGTNWIIALTTRPSNGSGITIPFLCKVDLPFGAYHHHADRYQARLRVVKLSDQGWTVSIRHFMKVSSYGRYVDSPL